MEKLIFRKFIYDVFIFFLLTSISITLIVWVIQAVNYLDFISEDGHSFQVYFLYILLTLPKLYGNIVIFSFFISIFYTLSKYQDNNEILIFWANGISKIQFVNVILKFSLIMFILQILLNFFIVPKTQDMARSYIRTSNIDYLPSLIKPKQFIDTVEDLTIFVEKKNKNGVLENILLKDQFNKKDSQIITAKKGFIIKKNNTNYLILQDGKIINIDGKDSNIFKFDKTEFNLSKHTTKTTTYPKIQEINSYTLFSCLKSFIEFNKGFKLINFSCDDRSINPTIQELFKRTFAQFYVVVVSLVGSALLIINKDNFKFNIFKLILFLFGISLVIIKEFNIQYLDYYSNLNYLSASMPIFFFLTIYLCLIFNLKFVK